MVVDHGISLLRRDARDVTIEALVGNLNAIWYIEGIYSTLRVQHNNGTGIRKEQRKTRSRTSIRARKQTPSAVLRHPLRTSRSLPHDVERQKEITSLVLCSSGDDKAVEH